MHGKSSKGFDVCVPDIMEYIISRGDSDTSREMMVMVIVIGVEVLLMVALDLYL